MGSKERKEKHRLKVREEILAVACDLFEREGWEGVTIRKIANAIEYTSPTIYEHFENKEAIFQVLKAKWNEQLFSIIESIYQQQLSSKEKLEKILISYYEFAHTHPQFYKAIMRMEIPLSEEINSNTIAKSREIIKSLISQSLPHLNKENFSLDDAVDLMRGFLDGICLLSLLNRLNPNQQERGTHLILKGLHSYLKAWS